MINDYRFIDYELNDYGSLYLDHEKRYWGASWGENETENGRWGSYDI